MIDSEDFQLRLAHSQFGINVLLTMAGIAIGIGASMAVTSLSILASANVSTDLPPFLNPILNIFKTLGMIFVGLGILSIIIAWWRSKKDLKKKPQIQRNSKIAKCYCGSVLPCSLHVNKPIWRNTQGLPFSNKS